MKNTAKKIGKILIAAILISAMFTMSVFAASAAKATKKVRFRTAVVNQINLEKDASAKVIRGDEVLDAFEGMRLETGDKIVVNGDGKLYILVDQNKIIRLDKDTEVELTNTLLGTKVKMTLIKGSMFFNVVEKLPEDESLQFVYGNITISVRGTSGLTVGDEGKFGMLLTDGTVDATETLPTGEKVSSPIKAGQKLEFAEGNAENGTKSAAKVSSFTLSELPDSVIEEMQKDENLLNRIVDNVPLFNGPSGPIYGTPELVDLAVVTLSNADEDVMEFSKEIVQAAMESRGEAVPPQDSSEEESPVVVIEPKKDDVDDVIGEIIRNIVGDDQDMIVCPECSQEFGTAVFAKHILPCGHYVCEDAHNRLPCGHCDCEDDHELLFCGHCICQVTTENKALHVYNEASGGYYCQDSKWHYCPGCGQYIYGDAWNPDEHQHASCGEHYTCEDGYTAIDHILVADGVYACSPVAKYYNGSCYYCKAGGGFSFIRNWWKHLPVYYPATGEFIASCTAETGTTVICPLCGESCLVESISPTGTHLHYDATGKCITCGGVRQSTENFKAFLAGGFERQYLEGTIWQYGIGFESSDVDAILEFLGIKLDPDPEQPPS